MKNEYMKKIGIILISLGIIVLLMFMIYKLGQNSRNVVAVPDPGVDFTKLAQKRIKDIFLNNQYFYCLNGLGELYIRENMQNLSYKMNVIGGNEYRIFVRENYSDKHIYSFPNSEVKWSEKYKAFIFCDAGKNRIFSYDPLKDSSKELYEIKLENNKGMRNYIVDVVNEHVILNIFFSNDDQRSYKINLDTKKITRLENYADYSIARNSNMILYKVRDKDKLVCLDLKSNKENELNNEILYNHSDLSIDIKSTCIVDNTLYFTKSDGKIYGVKLDDQGAKNIQVFPENSDISKENVIGIEWTGENFICVILNHNRDNGLKSISVLEIYSDGTYSVINKGEIIYNDTLETSCIIKLQREKYAYLIRSEDLVVLGWTFERK